MSTMNDSSTNDSPTSKFLNKAGNDSSMESRLRLDADKISGKVDEQQRQQLFTQLSAQASTETTPQHQNRNKVYFALAASVVALAILIPRTMEVNIFNPTNAVSTENPAYASDEALNSVQDRLLANQKLTNEYQAIVADMEKLKSHLVQL